MVSFTKVFSMEPAMDAIPVKSPPGGVRYAGGRGLRQARRRAQVGPVVRAAHAVLCLVTVANMGMAVFNTVNIQRLWQACTAGGGGHGTGVETGVTAAQINEQAGNCSKDHPRCSSLHVPVAHLAGLTGLQDPPSQEGSISTIHDWQVEPGGSSFWTHGMDVTSRQNIVVPLTGYYYVYNQLQFRQTSPGGADERTLHLTHIVLRRSGSSGVASRLLIGRATKKVSPQDGSWYRTSYVGGTFHLKAGDVLHVDVTNFDKVNPQESGTYFGARLLSL
ncbi:PREDICTED: tumor necrosis factor ligand superfamily member 15-like [Branchiostoma belcheri]|uniref:Tumor necrosis factor ligand superfamily member 15-like n=1 Tax=Branchiostoma belcheri TaxID=7741 RepID=A0A6P4XH01_BRABE|nr:PREDICTED: tumor necrosis factor ligand superfamily member 15-like [Branchiostoma belcheri]